MLIGIDGNEANTKVRVGVNVYAHQLLLAIEKLQDRWNKNHKIIIYLKEKPLNDLPKESDFIKYKILKGNKLWVITKLMPKLLFDSPKLDVFFTPSHYLPPLMRVKAFCSIMDLGYLNSSEQFRKYDFWQLKYWSAWSMFISKKIFAISQSTAKDIVRHYPLVKNKIIVTYLSYDREKFNQIITHSDVRRVKRKFSIGLNEYFLFLGTLKPSKNVMGIVKAYQKVLKTDEKIKLVIGGKKGWLYEDIFAEVKKLGLEDKVIFTGYVDEKDKVALIRGAKAFLLPSFWEGFGLDVLSSMASGIPVVISKSGSLPEVGGTAAIYVDPHNVDSIADGMNKVLEMKDLEYDNLVKRLLEQTRKFSWDNTAIDTMNALTES